MMSENPSLAITEVSRLMGQKWREMSEEDKAPWQVCVPSHARLAHGPGV